MLDLKTVDGRDDLSRLDASLLGRTALHDADNQRASGTVKAKRLCDIRCDGIEGRTDIGTLEAGIALFRSGNEHPDQIGRNGKPNTVGTATFREDPPVD